MSEELSSRPCEAAAEKEGLAVGDIAQAGVLIALLAVSAQVTVALGPIPFTLQTAVVILIALLMTPKQAAVTTGAYLLMGAAGLPVFSGMTGGIIRASSGFLFSYLIGTAIASAVRLQLEKRGVKQIVCDVVTAVLVISISDVLGWLWMMFFTQTDPLAAFLMADAPFIAIDCCKGAVAIVVATAVRKALKTA